MTIKTVTSQTCMAKGFIQCTIVQNPRPLSTTGRYQILLLLKLHCYGMAYLQLSSSSTGCACAICSFLDPTLRFLPLAVDILNDPY